MDIMDILVGAIILLVAAVVLMLIANFVMNASKPVIEQPATVVTKRQGTSGGAGNTSVSTFYYVTFEREDGTRVEFSVSGGDYGLLVEGDSGTLRTQGSWYKGFNRRLVRR